LEDVGKLFAIFWDPKSEFLKSEQKNRFFTPITFAADSSVKNYSYGFSKDSYDSIDFYYFLVNILSVSVLLTIFEKEES
jgi:hypothetical protein